MADSTREVEGSWPHFTAAPRHTVLYERGRMGFGGGNERREWRRPEAEEKRGQ